MLNLIYRKDVFPIKKIKRFTSLILVFSLLMISSMSNVFASDLNSDIYEETGQFSYTEYLEKKSLELSRKQSNSSLTPHYDNNSISPALTEEIERLEKDGHTIKAIGYTKIYLKEEEINNQRVMIPMTNQEVNYYEDEQSIIQPFATGSTSKSPGGNFTLYTVATLWDSNIYASSVGEYATYTWKPASETPQNGMYDYITISMPSQYTVTSPRIVRENYGYYRADETNNAVSYGVLLKASPSVPGKTSTVLSAVGIRNSNVNAKKIISSYVHNYNTARLSFSFSANGITFSVSPDKKTWKISSSVVIY